MESSRYAVVVGFDYHAQYLARVVNQHSRHWHLEAFPDSRIGTLRALWALRRADVLIAFGGPGPSIALAEAVQAASIPTIVIWAGTDVLLAAQNPFDLAVTKRRGYDNVAVAPWLVDELQKIGVSATTLSVGAVEDFEVALPKLFRVLTYLPEPRRPFYGQQAVYEIARRMPDVPFTVVGPGRTDPNAPANVTFTGNIKDVTPMIDASSVLLRLTEHDGMSILVLETLARGRHVIWTHSYPGIRVAEDTESAFSALNELFEKHKNGLLEANIEGREFVRRNFGPADVVKRFEEHLDRLVAMRGVSRNGHRKKRVAISGLGLFSAEVAKQLENVSPDWKARIVSPNSRVEVLASLLTLVGSDVWYSIGSPITDRWMHLLARLTRKPHVVHWVGTDIEYYRNTKSLHKHMQRPTVKHLTEVTWTSDELQELGLRSEIVPLPLRHYSNDVKPLPERFTILLYLPKSRPEFYGRGECEALLRDLAKEDVRVLVVGGGSLEFPAGMDVTNLGWRDDLASIFEEVTVLIRLTPRDGLSLMALEALSFGRYVVWSQPFPHTIRVQDLAGLIDAVRSLMERHKDGRLQPQYEASKMIADQYSIKQCVERIVEAWENARTGLPAASATREA